MENSSQNGKPEESTALTDQTKLPTKSEQQQKLSTSSDGIFIRRAKGMPFEEFKKACVKQFREAGLIQDVEPPSEEEMELQREMFLEMEESMLEMNPHWKESTTAKKKEPSSQVPPTGKS